MGKEEPVKNNANEGVPIKKRRFPVVRNDEQFVNNDDGAGVPIKKRVFPVLSPHSPTPQESNLGTAQESSDMDATIVSISVGKFDCPKSPFTAVKKVESTGSNIDIPNLASLSGVVRSQPAFVKWKLEPIANEGGSSKQNCNTEKIVSNDNIASANRSNWDLNTTMDAWGGFSDDAHQLDMVKYNESNEITGPCFEGGVKVDLTKQNFGDNDCRTEFTNLPFPFTQYRAEDMVHLSVSRTVLLANCVTELNLPLCSSASMPFASPVKAFCSPACAVSDSVMVVDSELLGQALSTKHSTCGINVKPKQSEGIVKHDSLAAKVNSSGLKHDLLNMPTSSSSSRSSGLSAVDCSKLPQQDSVAGKVNSEASLAIIKNEVVKSGTDITPNAAEEKQVKPALTSILTESTVKKAVGTVLQSQEIMNLCASLLPSSPDISNQGHSAKNTNVPLQGRDGLNMCRDEDSNTFGSDDEKLDISADMIEEDSYGYESESDSCVAKRTRGGKEEEEDFEDGEIRECLLRNTTLVVATGNRDCENSNLRSSAGLTDNVSLNHNQIKDKAHESIVGEDKIKEHFDANVVERSDNTRPAVAEIFSTSINKTQRRLDRNEELCHGGDKVTNRETKSAVGENQNECKKGEIEDSCLRTIDSSLNAQEDGARDADIRGGSGRSRIITLSRSSYVESPSKTRSGQESLYEWETRNERCTNSELDKLQFQRKRGEMLTDGPCRYTRDRFQQDKSFRGTIAELSRRRGRAYNDRFNSSEWVSPRRKFKQDNYSGQYQLSRNKHTAAIDDKLELCRYNLAQADAIASGMSERKPLNDEIPSFHNASSRRSSPIVRGPTASGIPMVRRVRRNFSPREEESFNILGNRHGVKYSRNLPPVILDPECASSQHANDGIDDEHCRKFSQHANEGIEDEDFRKFSFVKRSIPSRARSKSPTRTRMQSPPVAWSLPPRRRSPDRYNRIRELPHRQRSPPIDRVERARSPQLNFPDEFVPRRHRSPPYIAPPINDSERPIMSNQRCPSDLPIPRNNRQFDISLDSYERPTRSSIFDEIDEEGIGDDRRRLTERRQGRSVNGEKLRFRQEVREPNPLRFAPKGDLGFTERNTRNNSDYTREKTFDRRITNRPVIAPSRRIRAIEDEESDFRQGESAWHDDAFADSSREKRRRF